MAQRYKTRDGDTLDWIVWRHYGTTGGRALELVLEANPGLADHGPVLPAGLDILLPVLAAPGKVDGVRLWE